MYAWMSVYMNGRETSIALKMGLKLTGPSSKRSRRAVESLFALSHVQVIMHPVSTSELLTRPTQAGTSRPTAKSLTPRCTSSPPTQRSRGVIVDAGSMCSICASRNRTGVRNSCFAQRLSVPIRGLHPRLHLVSVVPSTFFGLVCECVLLTMG